MANQLDLEEQEQLDQLKHFWAQWGNLITGVLTLVLAAFAAWNGYQWWQRNQSAQASAMYDTLEEAARAKDTAKLDRALADMKDKFAGTTYAQQGALLAAKTYYEAGKADAAKAALAWVAEKSSDEGYQALARLRLAGLLLDAKSYDEALAQLAGNFPVGFDGLVADRKGDIYLLQGKKDQAKEQYQKAYKAFDERSQYRPLVEFKLNSLGVNVAKDAAAATPAAATASAASTESKK
jgi:predicted negative regulator of RcsB-dependent stress response